MASASVSGLVSGLDTSTIISQLMQVEANPQTLLKTRLSTAQSNITTLQSLNAQFASLVTKADALAKTSAWTPLTAKSSSDQVSVVAGSNAPTGVVSFTVQQTAKAHSLTFASTAAGSDVVTSGSTSVTLTVNGEDLTLETGDGSLAGLVGAINDAHAGVTASTVKLDDGTLRLRVSSDTSGAASAFTLTNTDGSDLLGGATVVAGQDAAVTIGSDTVHSSSNTFTGLVTGLDVTINSSTPTGTAVDVTLTRDATSPQAAVKDLVDSANAILTQIDKLTAYNAATKTSGPLGGDPTIRDLRSKILDSVTRSADGTSMSGLGIATDRFGKITFDATAFASAYAADSSSVAAKLGAASSATTPGFAARLSAAAGFASDPDTGLLTTNITSRQTAATSMQTSIDDWDVRLATKQAAYNRQFTALEVSLSKLNNQSSWLTGQVNALTASKSSS